MRPRFFYEIDSKYIDFLSKFSEHLFQNAKITQTHSRKYVGIQKEEQIINNAKSVYNHKITNDGKSKLSQRCAS